MFLVNLHHIQIVLGAPAGFGIMSMGLILSQTANDQGFFVWDYQEYPSLIKGGNNSYFIEISPEKVQSTGNQIDVLVAFDQETYDLHSVRLRPGAIVIFPADKFDIKNRKREINYYSLQSREILERAGLPAIALNILFLGIICNLLNFELVSLQRFVQKAFEDKNEEAAKANTLAVQKGYELFPGRLNFSIKKPRVKHNTVVLNGNEAASLGAIAANCRFYSAYPMTPASGILHFLANNQDGIIVKHAEDEISAINMAVGASFAGVRSATGTSGGGCDLMTEAVSMAGMAEIPLVIFLSQRTGPSTGLPTFTGQGDLNFAINTSHGEFPRVVIAPGDTIEMFEMAKAAFALADLVQTPVFVLYDKMLAECHESIIIQQDENPIDRFKARISGDLPIGFKRYSLTASSGVSLRSLPGQVNGVYLANSYEHDETGFATENALMTQKQMEKRMKKLELVFQTKIPGFRPVNYFGCENPKLIIVSWGSNKGAILDAMKEFPSHLIGFLQIVLVEPFPEVEVKKYLSLAEKIISLEGNYAGQMTNLVESRTGVRIKNRLLKYNGRHITRNEIIEFIKNNLTYE